MQAAGDEALSYQESSLCWTSSFAVFWSEGGTLGEHEDSKISTYFQIMITNLNVY